MNEQVPSDGQLFATRIEPDNSPLTHQELFSAVHQHASEIARLTAAVPVECRPVPPKPRSRAAEDVNARSRWVGDKLWWDIDQESISDEDLRRWCYLNLSENWNSCAGGIVNYHVAAYKHRRDAISEYLK